MSYDDANQAKASFDDVYDAPTPHAYIISMSRHGYEIGEQARPYCTAAAELLRDRNGDAWPVQMLDIGCSYGIGSAFVKYGCSFDEMVAFFSTRAPREYHACCEATRMWLNITPPVCDVRGVGLDRSSNAIRFAVEAGLLDGGIAKDFEDEAIAPQSEDRSWFRSCNLLISTGAIGYVTDRTLDFVLQDLGRDHPSDFGPLAVTTILRLFELEPIREVFERNGFRFGTVPGALLPQRRFVDDAERQGILDVLHGRGVDTRGLEDEGRQFAQLCIAAPKPMYPALLERMNATHEQRRHPELVHGYIQR